jgi:O-antigen ligase
MGGSIAQVGGDLGGETRQRASAPGRQNDALMWALLFILAVAPLPLGSNRPFFWTASATAIGLVGAIYFAYLARRRQKLRVPLSSMRLQLVAFTILCGYLVVQMLPIAGVLGIDILASAGDVVIRSESISVAPGTTFLMLMRMMTYGLFFFLMLQLCRNEGRRALILNAILAIIAVYALIGLVSLRLGDTNLGLPKWAYFGSATGTFVNRNSYATFLAFGICIAATLLIRLLARRIGRHAADPEPGDGFQMVAYAAIYLLLLTTVVATQSRMGLFVSLAGTLTPLVLSIGLGSRPHATTAVVGLLASVVACGTVLAVFGSGVFERLGGIEKSAGTRFNLYDQILTMIANRPLTGTGGGTFDLAFPLEHELPVNPDVVWDKAHNTYLALWSELGLIFGSLPILMFLLLAARLAVSMAKGRGQSAQTIALAVLIVGGLHSLVDFSLEIQANTFIFLALTAIGIGAGVSRTRDDVQ